jgi:hypothetical protein
VIRKIFQIILWLAAGAHVVVGVLAITGVLGSAREADSLGRAYAVFGSMILMIGAMAAVATFLANKWPGWLIVALLVLCVGLPVGFFGAFWIDMEKGEVHRRQFQEEVRSGRYAFGNQPALLAVAQAVSANDHDAIRAAAKAVPDLQAPGRDGTTLLCFWSVLRNACKFTPENGTVSVRSYNPNARTITIEISDSGMGIEPQFIKRIFDPFEPGDSRREGLGLGLAISKAIVEMHRGTIRAHSEGQGKGATFVIDLRVRRSSQ